MSKQKVLVLILSVIGMSSTFLPWIKGFLGVNIHGLSSGTGDKSGIWIVMGCFVLISLICLLSKQYELKKWAIISILLLAAISMYVSIFYLTMDLDSKYIDNFLDISDSSELGLTIGPAPYVVLISGLFICIFCIALKKRGQILRENK